MTLIDLPFSNPYLNAPGTLGFHPEPRGQDWSGLGGFFTNPISFLPRTPAAGKRLLRFPGGVLLHTGHPNPGFSKVIRKYARHWERATIPVIVHLLAENPDEVYRMVRVLEDMENVGAVEIGLPPGTGEDFLIAVLQAAIGERPVIARIGLDEMPALIACVADEGAAAISFAPPRGSLPGSGGLLVSGRLAGGAVFPQALEMLRMVHQEGLPVIFSGGLTSFHQIDMVLSHGAAAVQLDLMLWREGRFSAPEESSSDRR